MRDTTGLTVNEVLAQSGSACDIEFKGTIFIPGLGGEMIEIPQCIDCHCIMNFEGNRIIFKAEKKE